ncbi:unnamed protein product [Symbiodinium sp. KB8]|nr:unnamed protein product [Symbiodinium sp. KB8]
MAPADAMPVLPEHDITVVNTFVQVSEARPRHRLQRSQTAPVTAADDEAEEQPETEEQTGEAHFVSEDAEPKAEKEVIEDCPDPSEPVKMSVKKLQTLKTLNRFETPDPWDLEAICKSLDEEQAMQTLPAKAASSSKPRLVHSATPDRWEWDAMVQEEKMIACIAQAAPMVSLLTVPTLAIGAVASAMPAAQPGCEYPRLLGSVSPASQGSPKPVSPSVSPRVRLGTLETTHLDENRELVNWYVDATKFDSNSERLLSPEFVLHFPGHAEPFTFRMVILATQTGGKHGAGFKKAKGRGSIELKCSSAVPSGVDSVTALVTIGEGARKQIGAKPTEHNFGDKTCCQLPNGEEADWDFKQSVSRDAKCLEIAVEIHF